MDTGVHHAFSSSGMDLTNGPLVACRQETTRAKFRLVPNVLTIYKVRQGCPVLS
jgi:hypothetical protein